MSSLLLQQTIETSTLFATSGLYLEKTSIPGLFYQLDDSMKLILQLFHSILNMYYEFHHKYLKQKIIERGLVLQDFI